MRQAIELSGLSEFTDFIIVSGQYRIEATCLCGRVVLDKQTIFLIPIIFFFWILLKLQENIY